MVPHTSYDAYPRVGHVVLDFGQSCRIGLRPSSSCSTPGSSGATTAVSRPPMRSSRLPALKTLDQFDFAFQPSIKREQIESLLWGFVNMLDAQIRRLDRGVDRMAPEMRDLEHAQDGTEVEALELELVTDRRSMLCWQDSLGNLGGGGKDFIALLPDDVRSPGKVRLKPCAARSSWRAASAARDARGAPIFMPAQAAGSSIHAACCPSARGSRRRQGELSLLQF